MSRDWSELSGTYVSRRTLLKFSMGSAAALALSACGGSPGSDAGSGGAGKPQRGGRLQAAWNLDKFTSLDPQLASGADQMGLLINVCEGLTRLTPALGVEGALAESWDVSRDGLTYTFHLRPGVAWHNGDEFTAQDMVFTYERGSDPSLGSPSAGGLVAVRDVEAPDDHTFVIHLKQPFAPLLTQLTGMPGRIMSPVNKRALEQMGSGKYGLQPVGTGPFRISDHVPGDHITLVRFDDYWDQRYPLLDEVGVDLVPEPSTVQSGLLAGDIEFVNVLQASSYATVSASNNVQTFSIPGTNWWGLWMNQGSKDAPFLADPRVRLAFAKAIDRDELIRKAWFNQADIGYGVYNRAIAWANRPDTPQTLAYDPEGARRLLSDADASGVQVAFMTSPTFKRTDEVIADMLSRIGVGVSLDLVEDSVYSVRGYSESNYQILHSGSAADPDPDDSVYNYFHSDGAYNTYGYGNPRADALIEQQRRTMNRGDRVKVLAELEDVLLQDAASAFTYHSRDLVAMGAGVHGYEKIPELRSLRTAWVEQ
jgi:peptide/nickel transport system substrate-binding protein